MARQSRRRHTSPCTNSGIPEFVNICGRSRMHPTSAGEVDSICFASEANTVGWGAEALTRTFGNHRGAELPPPRLPPITSGVADLPLSGGGTTEFAAPPGPNATALAAAPSDYQRRGAP